MIDYYETTREEIFNDIKEKSIKIWKDSYSDEFGYVSEKLNIINEINNYKDNALYIVAMFDSSNTRKLLSILKEDSKKFIEKRLWCI